MKVLAVAAILIFFAVSVPISALRGQSSPDVVSKLDGVWLGELHTGAKTLWIQVRIQTTGPVQKCLWDSIDQKAFGIPCRNLVMNGNAVSFDVPTARGKWRGTLSEDGKTLTGMWTHGSPLPLTLEWQRKQIDPPEVKFDPAMPPVYFLSEVLKPGMPSFYSGEIIHS